MESEWAGLARKEVSTPQRGEEALRKLEQDRAKRAIMENDETRENVNTMKIKRVRKKNPSIKLNQHKTKKKSIPRPGGPASQSVTLNRVASNNVRDELLLLMDISSDTNNNV